MFNDASSDGWSRVAVGLDVKVQHGVPVRIANTASSGLDSAEAFNKHSITSKILQLTGFTVSMHDWVNISTNEQQWAICVDKNEFDEVLRRLAISSAAMFVDRFHKAIDETAVDWDNAEYNYDFNHAIEHCCIPYGTLNKQRYFAQYIKTMHEESVRLVEQGISPMVEAE